MTIKYYFPFGKEEYQYEYDAPIDEVIRISYDILTSAEIFDIFAQYCIPEYTDKQLNQLLDALEVNSPMQIIRKIDLDEDARYIIFDAILDNTNAERHLKSLIDFELAFEDDAEKRFRSEF